MSDDNEHVLCLEQAMRELGWNGNPLDESREPCGPALRPLFVCLIHEGADWQALHDMAGDALLDDFLQEAGDHDEAHEQFLQDIACRMRAMGRDPKRDFNIPLPQTESSELERAHAMTTKNNKRYHDEYHAAENQMTDQQRQIYDTVVKSDTQDNGGCFYIDGKAGRGKSTVIRAITARLRHDGHVVLNTASTGVAALDYEAGSTAHTMFRIPVDDGKSKGVKRACSVTPASQRGQLLSAASLITWDEIPMAHRFDVEAVDQMLQDVRGCDRPFGGVTFLAGGDFRQVAPVVPGANAALLTAASVRKSPLWPQFTLSELTWPLRDRQDPPYSCFVDLLGIGHIGAIQETSQYKLVYLPPTVHAFTDIPEAMKWIAPYDISDITFAEQQFTQWVLEQAKDDDSQARQLHCTTMLSNINNAKMWENIAILAPYNTDVDQLNQFYSDRIPADAVKLFSYDRRKPSDGTSPVDSAHGGGDLVNEAGKDASAHWDGVDPDLLDQVGIPSHCIQLKVGDIVMCMRNLATSDGLVNGTRLIVVKIHFKERLIECITLQSNTNGVRTRFFIPRIHFELEVQGDVIDRRQYPLRHAYAMTLNKAQGKTFSRGLLLLTRDVFAHGQLYVGLTRFGAASDVTVLVSPERRIDGRAVVLNVVSSSLLPTRTRPKRRSHTQYIPPAKKTVKA